MKIKITIVFFFTGVFSIFAQKDALLKEATQMYQDTYNLNFEGILDATYPKIFEIASRDKLYKGMEESFQNNNFKIRLVYPEITFKLSEIKEIENKKVALLTYNSAMRMTFALMMSTEDAKEMLSNLKQGMLGKKIVYEPTRNSFLIEGEETMIAILDAHTNNTWKFITYDKAQKLLLTDMLGKNVLKELGL